MELAQNRVRLRALVLAMLNLSVLLLLLCGHSSKHVSRHQTCLLQRYAYL
jgi:hypothetical protein